MKFIPIMIKDLKILFKDPSALVVLFLMPIMFISVMSFALMPIYSDGGEQGIKILLVDQDKTEQSASFLKTLKSVDGLQLLTERDGKTVEETLSKQLVEDGEYPIALIIPDQFDEKIISGNSVKLLMYQDPAQATTVSVLEQVIQGVAQSYSVEFTVNKMVDDQVVDISKRFETELALVEERYTQEIQNFQQVLQEISVNAGIPIELPVEDVMVERQEPDYTSMKSELTDQATKALENPMIGIDLLSTTGEKEVLQPDSFQQNVPGYTVMFAFFIVMFAGRSFLTERNEGTFSRILAAPVNQFDLFLGKLLPNYFIGLLQVILLFAFGRFVLGMDLGNSFAGLILISLALVWASSCLGMLVASVFKTESQISGWSVLIVLTLAALGGTMVPLFIMPDIMQKVALITPHAWALNGYQDILVRGLGLKDVLLNAAALLGFGTVFLSISMWRLRY